MNTDWGCSRMGGLRKLFVPKKEKVRGDWVKLYDETHQDFSPCQIVFDWSNQENDMGGECSTHWREAICIQISGGKTWKRLLGSV